MLCAVCVLCCLCTVGPYAKWSQESIICVCIVYPFTFELYWATWRHMEQFSSPTPFLHAYPVLAPLAAHTLSQQKSLPSSWLYPVQELFYKSFCATLLLLWSTRTRTHTLFLELSPVCLVAFGTSQTLFSAALLVRLQTVSHYISLAHSGLIISRKTSLHYKKNLQECSDKEGFSSSLMQCETVKFRKHCRKIF